MIFFPTGGTAKGTTDAVMAGMMGADMMGAGAIAGNTIEGVTIKGGVMRKTGERVEALDAVIRAS